MDERKVLANRMSALKDCWPWEMWSWGAFMEAIGIDRSSNWEDTVDRVCRLIGGDPEREAAADWVEANGGLDDVQERMGLYSDMLSRIDSIVCGGRRDRFAADTPPDDTVEPFDAILDALVERLMPDGMKWPRFEDGAKVRFGDEYENSNGNVSVASRFGFKADEYLINRGTANGWKAYGKLVKRPKPAVIAADGLPIREGETVYAEFSGSPLVVERIEGAYLLDAGGTMLRADCATHTPPDTQERIDDDATMPPRAYYAKHIGHDVGLKDDAECTEAMVRHLLNRQRGLDKRTMGGAE